MQRSGVEVEDPPFERERAAPAQPGPAREIDVEARDRRGLQGEPQRGAPLVELAGDAGELTGGEVAGIEQVQREHHEVLVLDRRRVVALRVERERPAFDAQRAGVREERMQLDPLRRNPLLVAKQAHLGIVAEVGDLARDEFRQLRLPLAALGPLRDLACERAVADEEALREVEQRLPQLVLDLARPVRVLDVLRRQVAPQCLGARIEAKQRLEARQRSLRAAFGRTAERGDDLGVQREGVVGGKRSQPALGRLGVDQGILRWLAESEHRDGRAPERRAFAGRGVRRAGTECHRRRSQRRHRCPIGAPPRPGFKVPMMA